MATITKADLSTPEAAVASYLRAWRDGDPDAQWECLLKVDPEGMVIEHHVTPALSERWDRAAFRERFPQLKAKYYDRYELKRLRSVRSSSDKVRVHYAARRKDSLLRSVPFWLSKSRWLLQLFEMLFGLLPWYDTLSWYDVVPRGDIWLIADWCYYKY